MRLQPQEIEVWYVLPSIRREMCKELASVGVPQKDVARVLGITEAAVSHYMNAKRAAKINFNRKFVKNLKDVCKKVSKGKISAYNAIQILAREFRRAGGLCYVHSQLEATPQGCKSGLGPVCRK